MIFSEYVGRVQALSICTSAGGCSLLANGCFCGMPFAVCRPLLLSQNCWKQAAAFHPTQTIFLPSPKTNLLRLVKFIRLANSYKWQVVPSPVSQKTSEIPCKFMSRSSQPGYQGTAHPISSTVGTGGLRELLPEHWMLSRTFWRQRHTFDPMIIHRDLKSWLVLILDGRGEGDWKLTTLRFSP